MKVKEIIKQYRKERNLTQEQVANYLGVSTPAVNKWESGVSYPDITLLPQLARVLKIDLNTLLSFNDELSVVEISQIIEDVSTSFRQNDYQTAFEKGKQIIREHLNCDTLVLNVVSVMQMYLMIQEVDKPEIYEMQINEWYEILSQSNNNEISARAISALCQYYMDKEMFDKAQEFLDKIPERGFDKRVNQAILYNKQENKNEAYKILETILLQAANEAYSSMQFMMTILAKDGKIEEAEYLAQVCKKEAELLQLGSYVSNTPDMMMATINEDKERWIKAMDSMIDSFESIGEYTETRLYSHLTVSKNREFETMKLMLRQGLEKDDSLEFVKNTPEFKRILEKLK